MKRKRRKSRGAAMVELALILPVLILLIFAAMEYGWMFMRASQVGGAARQGARAAVRPDATDEEVEAAIAQIMEQSGLTGTNYSVDISDLAVAVTEPVTVRVTLSYDDVALTGFVLLPVPESLIGQSTMAKEGP